MRDELNKLLIFFRLALVKELIEVSCIVKWADNEIMNKDISYEDNFIFDLSLSNNANQIVDSLDFEITKRGIGGERVEGKMFLQMFQTKKILSERDLLSIIDVMLELTHEVYFTKEELEGIYFIDECRDEYFEEKMDIKEVKKAFKDFVWQKE